ncbi:MAG: hypothetical protein H7230_01760 [Candidatus Parcubacteria bacterium]|nr:hypothetical protein [Candidatus Paceibacterota bacterium]
MNNLESCLTGVQRFRTSSNIPKFDNSLRVGDLTNIVQEQNEAMVFSQLGFSYEFYPILKTFFKNKSSLQSQFQAKLLQSQQLLTTMLNRRQKTSNAISNLSGYLDKVKKHPLVNPFDKTIVEACTRFGSQDIISEAECLVVINRLTSSYHFELEKLKNLWGIVLREANSIY